MNDIDRKLQYTIYREEYVAEWIVNIVTQEKF